MSSLNQRPSRSKESATASNGSPMSKPELTIAWLDGRIAFQVHLIERYAQSPGMGDRIAPQTIEKMKGLWRADLAVYRALREFLITAQGMGSSDDVRYLVGEAVAEFNREMR